MKYLSIVMIIPMLILGCGDSRDTGKSAKPTTMPENPENIAKRAAEVREKLAAERAAAAKAKQEENSRQYEFVANQLRSAIEGNDEIVFKQKKIMAVKFLMAKNQNDIAKAVEKISFEDRSKLSAVIKILESWARMKKPQ